MGTDRIIAGERWRPESTTRGKERWRRMAAATKKCIRCEDCFFKQNMLCALDLDEPCVTFRPASQGLRPQRQLAFVFRTERTRTAYAFPQPQA